MREDLGRRCIFKKKTLSNNWDLYVVQIYTSKKGKKFAGKSLYSRMHSSELFPTITGEKTVIFIRSDQLPPGQLCITNIQGQPCIILIVSFFHGFPLKKISFSFQNETGELAWHIWYRQVRNRSKQSLSEPFLNGRGAAWSVGLPALTPLQELPYFIMQEQKILWSSGSFSLIYCIEIRQQWTTRSYQRVERNE